MIFKLQIDKDREEEITATVHRRTPLIDEIEKAMEALAEVRLQKTAESFYSIN